MLLSDIPSGSDLMDDGVGTKTGDEEEVLESFFIALEARGGVADEVFELSWSFMGRNLGLLIFG